MKLLVPVKRVVDYNVKVRVKSDGSGVDIAQRQDVDEPVRRDRVRGGDPAQGSRGVATEVVAVSLGEARCSETLRTALAMGADRAILVESAVELQPLAVAKLLAAIVAKEQPGLVLMGKQAIDDDSNQAPQMLAALLGLAAGDLHLQARASRTARPRSVREVDEGLERLAVQAAGGGERGSAPERAALRVAAQHHEGEEEAAGRAHARGSRRRRDAAAAVPEVRGAAASGRPGPRSARWPSWWASSRPRRGCWNERPGPGPARQRARSTRRRCTR